MKGGAADTPTGQADAQSSRSGRLTPDLPRVARHASRQFIVAWQFLTAVPLTRRYHEPAPNELAWSMAWYPFVGLLLGGVLAGLDTLWLLWLSTEVASALVVLLLIALTGGLHQDGLADLLDGLAGGRTPPERLAIMRDPRVGALGATGLCAALILRYAALVSLAGPGRFAAILCMPMMGRWAMVAGAWGSRYARAEGGVAAPFLAHLSLSPVLGATLFTGGVLLFAFGPVAAATGVVAGIGLSRLLTLFYHRRFGGVTGDMLGATNEAAELAFLVMMPLVAGSR